MTMRIIQGFSAGQAFVARGRSLTDREVSQELLDGLAKLFGGPLSPEDATARILADVRTRGDEALREWSRRIDGADLQRFAVDPDEIETAYEETPLKVRESLAHAAERIQAFHEKQPRRSWLDWGEDGAALGQVVRPLARVGVYVPGGRAAYPSSLLMAVVPAQVAGVKDHRLQPAQRRWARRARHSRRREDRGHQPCLRAWRCAGHRRAGVRNRQCAARR